MAPVKLSRLHKQYNQKQVSNKAACMKLFQFQEQFIYVNTNYKKW